jgi:ERCC4-type nuclease
LTILVDHRETPSGVLGVLEELSVDTKVVSLPVADYIVARGVGVERKRVDDLHRCVANGRLWTQIASLRADLDTAFLLVEGGDVDRGCLSANGVRGALLEVMRLGIHVIRSVAVEDTGLWLTRIAARSAQPVPSVSPRRSRLRPVVTPRLMLCGVPGISPRLADALLDEFGSIAGLAAASTSDLLAVRGLGPARIAALRRALTGH